jgi:DNA-binding NarL/FixJ family response regulator
MERPRILIADDHAPMAEHIRALLDPEFDVVGVVANGQELVEAAQRLRPDGIVLDISMPVMNGLAAARRLRELRSAAKMLFLSQHTETAYVEAALQAGGDGYVVKRSAVGELRGALQAVLRGQRFVSRSLDPPPSPPAICEPDGPDPAPQDKVLELLAQGRTLREVADRLHLSERAVERHEERLRTALGLATLDELRQYARQHGPRR